MNGAGIQIRRGSEYELDGELFEVTDFISGVGTFEVVLRGPTSFRRTSLVELLARPCAHLIPDSDGPEPDDPCDPAAIALLGLSPAEMKAVREKADHVREVLTGYRSGSPELALSGEPRPEFDPARKLMQRYDAKRIELGVGEKTVRSWVRSYRERGEAGLVSRRTLQEPKTDPRWDAVADAIMREHTEESMPTKTAVILQTSARLELLYGVGEVKEPSRATANRHLLALDEKHPTFRGTTKRNRDIANSPEGQHGKLRPTRPGEYLILDTTRLDVFGFDPATLRWMQIELTAAMDWYTRCIVALRLTPVSTKAVDAAAVMYQVFRPLPAPPTWPADAVWPYHGMPREVLINPDKVDRTGRPTMGPALRPDTIVVDHGKIYLSEHLNSVCQRFGISIQPARLREGRDKAPLERFFGTVRTRMLQYLPGYKGPNINSRGLDVQGHAFYYINELETILREWVAMVYHRVPHDSLCDPEHPAKQSKKAKMSPAQMYSHGIARAGYIEVPRHPDLALEFLRAEPRTIQAKGVRMHNLIYKGDVLTELRAMKSPYEGRFKDAWPIHVDPDDISRVYIQHPYDRQWHQLDWEHASQFPMVFSDDALAYSRELAIKQHGFVDEQFALRELFKRFNLSIELSPKERRIVLRMSREEQMLSKQIEADDAQAVESLSSLRALTNADGSPNELGQAGPEMGDDDDIADIEDDYDDESFDLA